METVLRATAIYLILLIVLRMAGRRTPGEMTSFDFVLLLIIGEATQQALLVDDSSITIAVLVIVTLLLIDIVISLVKSRWQPASRWIEGVPTILVADGKPISERLRMARITEDDVLEAARRLQGLERMDQIKYAVIEVTGGISIIPREPEQGRDPR